ncbi:MAG: ChbG/HpnK family deacetylase [Candidatus Aminicenantales bacterium]
MIIITADDYGKTRHATDSILKCFSNKSITSASVMVFMEDSKRAAPLALQAGMEVGLHINFTMPFSVDKISSNIRDRHSRVISYLSKSKLAQIIYNPLLADSFDFLFKAQLEEFMRLYGKAPDFYNGHHHMHLCANMLMGKILPKGARARRTFTLDKGEVNLFNLFYRRLLDNIIARRYISTDCFFSILPLQNHERLRNIFNRAVSSNVEIEVHPENADEIGYLLGDQYLSLMESAHVGNFNEIIYRS